MRINASRVISQYGRQDSSLRNWLKMASLDRYNHKKAFIQEQIRIFKQPFKPSPKWLTPKKHNDHEGDEDDDNTIPPSVINSVVVRCKYFRGYLPIQHMVSRLIFLIHSVYSKHSK